MTTIADSRDQQVRHGMSDKTEWEAHAMSKEGVVGRPPRC